MTLERHPLEPFLPSGATTLFLGSFPPPRERWSMDFFYPNFINDFWRVQGLIHFGDARWFELRAEEGRKRFDRERIEAFCAERGLAFFDTATAVRRLKDNASDAFLEIVEPTDVGALLARMPACCRLVTTGGKASDELAAILSAAGATVLPAAAPAGLPPAGFSTVGSPGGTGAAAVGKRGECAPELRLPPIGDCVRIRAWDRPLEWWRMPSTSRAYPLSLDKKVAFYRRLFL